MTTLELERTVGPLEYRAATQIGVSYPKRTVELVVMPYESETMVEYHGRWIKEIVSRSAFDGINVRHRRVTANRDHDETRLCGRAVAFHPSRDEGLVAEIKMYDTILGEETLRICADEGLDASAGFRPMTDRRTGRLMESWPDKNYRRLEKVWLGHIALTPDPAYEGAKVLAVRSGPPVASEGLTTPHRPNLARARALILSDEYDSLSR